MSQGGQRDNDLTALDELIEKITVDANGDDEQLWAFRQAFEDDVSHLRPPSGRPFAAERGLRSFPERADSRLREFLAQEYHRRERHDEAMALWG